MEDFLPLFLLFSFSFFLCLRLSFGLFFSVVARSCFEEFILVQQ